MSLAMMSQYSFNDFRGGMPSIQESPMRTYQLEVAQQPIRARMCGFGEKDRRPIDPPPVVRLRMKTPEGHQIPESSVDATMFIVHADLWSNNCKEERSLVINPSSIPAQAAGPSSSVLSLNSPSCTRNLMGSLTSSAYILTNEHGETGIYFIFQDLSVRTEGTFTLKFSFADITGLIANPMPQTRSRVDAEVYSKTFTVYSAKKFPGMTESTNLSKAFAKQGIKIPIRKDTRYRRSQFDEIPRPIQSSRTSPSASGVGEHERSESGDEKRAHHEVSSDSEFGDGGSNDEGVTVKQRRIEV